MNFFESQERAHKKTRHLVVLFTLAVLGIIASLYVVSYLVSSYESSGHVRRIGRRYDDYQPAYSTPSPLWNPGLLAKVTAGTLLVVGGASLYKWIALREGGSAVAEMAGGRRIDLQTTDLAEKRLLNIVEEMAIASGIPVPPVYILSEESGINAFAAGHSPSDAVVAVTRGTLEKLNRDELQGVIGHEFSHILNGDMRINQRLLALLFGILAIGLVGRGLLEIGLRSRGDRKGGIFVFLGLGVALFAIGYIGYFFGRLIQAAISRQREFLADASSVQFTRNPQGISGALKKIGGYALGSSLTNQSMRQISHFFFASGFTSSLLGALDTHPPLDHRIRAVEPQWDGKFFEPPQVVDIEHTSFAEASAATPPWRSATATPTAPVKSPLATNAGLAAAVALAGSPTPEHLAHAQNFLQTLPPRLGDAARNPAEAPALIYALLLDPDSALRAKQMADLLATTDSNTLNLLSELSPLALQLPADSKLPLLNLALPALRQLDDAAVNMLEQNCANLIAADGFVSTFEFALQKVLFRHLHAARSPAKSAVVNIYSFQAVTEHIGVILSSLAHAGSDDPTEIAASFADGASQLPLIKAQLRLVSAETCDFRRLNEALNHLATASLPIKQRTLTASAYVVAHDGVIRPTETELLRAFADALECPMPPLLAAA